MEGQGGILKKKELLLLELEGKALIVGRNLELLWQLREKELDQKEGRGKLLGVEREKGEGVGRELVSSFLFYFLRIFLRLEV